MFERIKSYFKNSKAKEIIWQDGVRPGCNQSLPFICSKGDGAYDNAFSDIVRIAESFAEVMPFAVDAKGKRLAKQPHLVEVLYNPNQEMSGPDFFETLITMLLVHPLVHILLWHYEDGELVPGGPVTPDNIAGLTFLEDAVVSRVNGVTTFYQGTKTWTRQDVITLSLNVNPYRILDGYSPVKAVRKWATVDDYIADYQIANFGNGGVPAGVMTITAPTVEEYNEAVDRLEANHTGVNNVNRIVYNHRPTSSIDGRPETAGLEWTPFSQTNKEMTLDALFNQANKKIDMDFGVPEEVKGYLQNSNYASAEVADYVFSRRVLYPKLVKVYAKLTHEFNRVMGGGIGFALTFDYEPPVLTDMRKVQSDMLISMVNAGFTVESAVNALQLPRSFLKLSLAHEEGDENMQVIETPQEKPEQAVISSKSTTCGHKHKAIDVTPDIVNPTLKTLLSLYITDILQMVASKVDSNSANPVQAVLTSVNAVNKIINTDAGLQSLRDIINAQLFYLMAVEENAKTKDFAARVNLVEPVEVISSTEIAALSMSIQNNMAQIQSDLTSNTPIVLQDSSYKAIVEKIDAALVAYKLSAVIPSLEAPTDYSDQVSYLLDDFASQTLDLVSDAALEITDILEFQVIINSLISSSEYRLNRWVMSEQHRAEELGSLLAAMETGDAADLEPVKIWVTRDDDNVCVNCAGLNGSTVRADQKFPNGNMVPHDHPHCRCSMEFDFRTREKKSVKVTCPNCKRYMFESTGGVIKNVICANSKCKKHYDIEVKGGIAEANERSAS